MTLVGNVKMSKQEFDAIACRCLGSEFTGEIYADWPIDLGLSRPQRDGQPPNLLLNRGHATKRIARIRPVTLQLFLLFIVVVTALAFDFTNGFHDTGNAIAARSPPARSSRRPRWRCRRR